MKYVLPWGILLLLATGIYWPGLQGSFLFDDFANIVNNPAVHAAELTASSLSAALSGPEAGPLGRPVSILSFAATHAAFGLDPFAFKSINLIIHLANGLLVGWLAHLLLAAIPSVPRDGHFRWLPWWIAALWLLHPINVMPVLMAVQRMTLLSGLFLLLALLAHLKGIGDARHRSVWLVAAWCLFWPLSVFSKETGLLFPLYALLATQLIRRDKALPILAAIATLGILAAATLLYKLGWSWLDAGYAMRSFTLTERLLTEARVLWFYLGQIVMPSHAGFALYLDGIPISSGLLQPPRTALAVAAWALVLCLLPVLWRRWRILCFGIAWFLAGHLLESTFLPLEIAHEHRNYLPAFGPVFAVGYLLATGLSRMRLDYPAVTAAMAAILMIGVPASMTWMRNDQWSDTLRGHQIEAIHHPGSARANYYLAINLVQHGHGDAGDPFGAHLASFHFREAAMLDPMLKAAHIGLVVWACASGRPVEPEWIDQLADRLETRPYGPGDRELPGDLLKPMIAMPACLTRADALRLFEAGSRNSRITQNLRANFLEAAAEYELLVSHDPPSALAYYRRASQANPASARLKERIRNLSPADAAVAR